MTSKYTKLYPCLACSVPLLFLLIFSKDAVLAKSLVLLQTLGFLSNCSHKIILITYNSVWQLWKAHKISAWQKHRENLQTLDEFKYPDPIKFHPKILKKGVSLVLSLLIAFENSFLKKGELSHEFIHFSASFFSLFLSIPAPGLNCCMVHFLVGLCFFLDNL